jgi:hypothetical protein
MDDLETREVLAVLAHMQKTQMNYLHRLHLNLVALYDALKESDPELESRYQLAAVRLRSWREDEDLLRSIDELIERLQIRK